MTEDEAIMHPFVSKDVNPTDGYIFFCPGCNGCHSFNTTPNRRMIYNPGLKKYIDNGPGPVWAFNGSLEKPTFSPSLLYKHQDGLPHEFGTRCHLFVTNGQIVFLNDCEHALRGQTVNMVPYRDWWK